MRLVRDSFFVIFVFLGKFRGGAEEYLVRLFAALTPERRGSVHAFFTHRTCFEHYRQALDALSVTSEFCSEDVQTNVRRVAELLPTATNIHLNGQIDFAAPFFRLRRRFRTVKFSVTNHLTTDISLDTRPLKLLRKVNRSFRTLPLFSIADPFIFVSQNQVELMRRNRFFRPRRHLVIYNGVELPCLAGRVPAPEPLTVGLVGTNQPLKSFDFALKTADCALDSGLDFRVKHFGDFGESLSQNISAQNASRFTPEGFVCDKDAMWRSFDILFSPGFQEACPYNVIEAMSYGLPVLLPETPLYRELYTLASEAAVLFYRKNDVDDAVRKLTRLLTEPDLRDALGTAGRQLVAARYELKDSNRRTWEAILGERFSPDILC